jgi:hypothetical protein
MRAPTVARVNVCVEVLDVATGAVVSRTWRHNRVVNSGLDLLRNALAGDAGVELTHGAVGTGASTPAAAQAALDTEVFRDLVASKRKTAQTLTVRFVLGSQHANGVTLTEAGLFTAAGTMYARVTPDPVAKTATQSVIYTWTCSWAPDEEGA